MEILKSSRHAKITGDFGETVVLYWLSKYGFECARVDHTGIDIIARNRHTRELMGLSVKSRSRTKETEEDYLTIPRKDFEKANAACEAFGCVPYFAFVVDAGETIRAFIVSTNHLLEVFPIGKLASGWKMTKPYLEKYGKDPEVKSFTFTSATTRWWSGSPQS